MKFIERLKKSEQGSVTIYVLSTLLVMLLVLITIYISARSKSDTQFKQNAKIEEEYNVTNEDMTKAYEEGYDILDELQIGDYVSYTPSGIYKWQAKYCSTTKNADVTLNSGTNDYQISNWRVFSIDKATKKVELIATNETTGKVYLGEAQGYNNGVKLLNDACNSLYGNTEKGISARSINIDDIEKYLTSEGLNYAHSDAATGIQYGKQWANKYTVENLPTGGTRSVRDYPSLWAKEKLSVINDVEKKEGLGMSEQYDFVEKTDSGASNGALRASSSIHPYQTQWERYYSGMKDKFKTAENGVKYIDLIIPKGNNSFWMASRCLGNYQNNGNFMMRRAYKGSIAGYCMMPSIEGGTSGTDEAILPIVLLTSNNIGKSSAGFFVRQ